MNQAKTLSGVLVLLLLAGSPATLPQVIAEHGKQAKKKAAGRGRDASGDPLPEGALLRFGSTRLRHLGRVLALDYSPNGKLIASGGQDGTVRLWNSKTGKETHRWEVEGGTQAVRFSQDGKLIACGVSGTHRVTRRGEAGTYFVHVWKVSTKKEVHRLGGLRNRITSVAFSSDGKQLAAGAGVFQEPGEIHIWNLRSGEELESIEGLARGVAGVDISPDGALLAGALRDNTVRVWSLPGAKEVKTLGQAIPHGGALVVAFSPDGKLLASERWGEGIDLWDTSTWSSMHTLKEHREAVWSLDFSKDGRRLASGGSDGKAILWDVKSGKPLQIFMRLEDKYRSQRHLARPVALSPNGKRLAAGHQDSKILIWNLKSRKEVTKHPGHEGAVFDVAFSPDGKKLYSGGRDATIRTWDVRSGKEIRRVADPVAAVLSLDLSPDGETLVTGGKDESVELWAASTGDSLKKWPLRDREKLRKDGQGGVSYYPRPALSVDFSPQGDAILVAAGDDQVLVLDPDSGETNILAETEGRPPHLTWSKSANLPRLLQAFVDVGPDRSGASFIPGTDAVLYRGGPSRVLVRDLTFGREWLDHELDLGDLKGPASFRGPEPRSLTVSPDGLVLALGTTTGSIELLELCTGKPIHTWSAHSAFTMCLAFSPDGRMLASAGMDEKIRIWSVSTREQIVERSGQEGWAYSLVYSPDGQTLASAGLDNTVLLWSLKGVVPPPSGSPTPVTDQDLDRLWDDLGGTDAAKASDAIWVLVESPAEVLRLVEQRSARAAAVDAKRVQGLIGDLEADDFETREQATEQLQDLGAAAESALRKKLESPDCAPETQKRIREIQAASLPPLESSPHEAVLGIRCVRLLGLIGSKEAEKVLDSLAQEHPSSFVRSQAEREASRIRSTGTRGKH